MLTPTLQRTVEEMTEARLVGVHTMMPGKVTNVDVKAGKCDVQPLIKRINADGVAVTLPVITNCPIGFYRAGKAAIYLPLKVDDGVEIRFCERSLDTWLSKGGTVDPADRRKHHLSDAVAYPGMYDFTNPPSDADPVNLVMVNDHGKITITPDGKFKIENDTGELFSILDVFLGHLIAAKVLDPLTGPNPFTPADILNFTQDQTKIQAMKV